jgi:hypothetical protein
MLDNFQNDYYAQFDIYRYLNNLANSENFWQTIESIYGTEFDRATTEIIRDRWQQGDFSDLPTISILDDTSADLKSSKATVWFSRITLVDNL